MVLSLHNPNVSVQWLKFFFTVVVSYLSECDSIRAITFILPKTKTKNTKNSITKLPINLLKPWTNGYKHKTYIKCLRLSNRRQTTLTPYIYAHKANGYAAVFRVIHLQITKQKCVSSVSFPFPSRSHRTYMTLLFILYFAFFVRKRITSSKSIVSCLCEEFCFCFY